MSPHLLIKNVHLPYVNRHLEQQLFNVACCWGRVWKIMGVAEMALTSSGPASWQELDGKGGLLIPA